VDDRRLAGMALTVTVAALVGYGAWTLAEDDESVPAPPVEGAPAAADPDDVVLTREQVAQHGTPDDCWTIVDDDVFDITTFLGSHPGGQVITEACGIDATELFEDRERRDGSEVGSGEGHSDDAEDQLEDLQIGVLPDD
jgi:cytochrome b involved in lipid metabolism